MRKKSRGWIAACAACSRHTDGEGLRHRGTVQRPIQKREPLEKSRTQGVALRRSVCLTLTASASTVGAMKPLCALCILWFGALESSCTPRSDRAAASASVVVPLVSFPHPSAPSSSVGEASTAATSSIADASCSTPWFDDDVGGDLNVHLQWFEGRVVVVDGEDPEQGRGKFPILVMDTTVCSQSGEPQREMALRLVGDNAKTDAFAKKWAGKCVRVGGDLRSMEVYAHPLRPTLLAVTQVEAL